ncbi:MAG: hypothetical protein K6G91_10410 [Kiritimatiellae bacterium]|nr:hypothetical protein [Kiritimatiellia bacterium]
MSPKAAIVALAVVAAQLPSFAAEPAPTAAAGDLVTFSADAVAVDAVTRAAVAIGNVSAAYGVFRLWSERLERDAAGNMRFSFPTAATTCTNDHCRLHWEVLGDLELKTAEHVLLRNAWLRFYGLPILYLPYLWYPLDTKCGFSWMPGYTGRWGGYLMTKYRYNIAGDPKHGEDAWWLAGATRFDLRYKNGVALGEDLKWRADGLGSGMFKSYWAWDEYASHRYDRPSSLRKHDYRNWGSEVDRDRYAFEASHRWEPTERDSVVARGSIYSDSFFRSDFMRDSFFNIKNQFTNYRTSGVFWEHVENPYAFGVEAAGRLNDFQSATERLPELYFDLAPRPFLFAPLTYETENRFGYLRRRYARNAADRESVFAADPAFWARYDAFRIDTYHRIAAPFRAFDDIVSVVPRVGYRCTAWEEGGYIDVTGLFPAGSTGDTITRSILEGGATFSARGTGWIDDRWNHLTEPYVDVLAQQAWHSGCGGGRRPYVFDAVDASLAWEDQFAGRGRNLPYSYYGVTPGWRNVWRKLDDKGVLRRVVDLDVYAAFQLNAPSFKRAEPGSDDSAHRLADPGSPNYGGKGGAVSPGARLVWAPSRDVSLGARVEYCSDGNSVPIADLVLSHKVDADFDWHAAYRLRDSRYWDFSSVPDGAARHNEDLNEARFHSIEVGFRSQPLDWFAWSPFVRWDLRDNELDCVGVWFEYLTDCLGFRVKVSYDNDYRRIDGSEYDEDWDVGFQVYLRAFGPDGNDIFKN